MLPERLLSQTSILLHTPRRMNKIWSMQYTFCSNRLTISRCASTTNKQPVKDKSNLTQHLQPSKPLWLRSAGLSVSTTKPLPLTRQSKTMQQTQCQLYFTLQQEMTHLGTRVWTCIDKLTPYRKTKGFCKINN